MVSVVLVVVVVEMTRITRCSSLRVCRIAVLVCRGRSVVEGMVLEPLASLDTSCLRFDDVAKTEEPPFVL